MKIWGDDTLGFFEARSRDRAIAKGKAVYRSEIECNRPGHGRNRYVAGRGCVICSDQRRAGKLRNPNPARTGISHTAEYRLWQAAKQRADAKGMEFTITISDVVIPETCPVFGTPLKQPSIDRFDNDRGYTPENIRVISRRANVIKSDATYDEIRAVAGYMAPSDPTDEVLG